MSSGACSLSRLFNFYDDKYGFEFEDTMVFHLHLRQLLLKIKPSRKIELVEINDILSTGALAPGHAGKFRGKLVFGSSQL